MPEKSIAQYHHGIFEGIRQLDANGHEYWSARDLAPLLEYQDWRNFLQVVDGGQGARRLPTVGAPGRRPFR